MANQFLTRQEILFESLDTLGNFCCFIPNCYRDLDQEFGKRGGKIGDTIYVRKPPRAQGRDGAAYNPEAMVDTEVPITINQQSGVDFEFSTGEKFESLDDLKRRYLDNYMEALANKLDSRMATMAMQNTGNMVGTVGTTPGLSGSDAFQIYSKAGQKLTELGFPVRRGGKGNRNLAVSAAMETGWNTYTKQFYNPADALTKQWKTGQVNNALNYQWLVTELTPKQTIGALGGTPAVVAASQTGTSININGLTASVTNWGLIGDVVSFAGVYAVNPQTRLTTGSLKQFSLQTNVTSDGAGAATLVLNEAIVPSGQFQNVTNSPAAGGLVNVYDLAAASQSALAGVVSPQALLWTPEAYAFTSFPGSVPDGVDMGSTFMLSAPNKDIGVELRYVRDFDGVRDMWINRFDVYYGYGPMYAEGGVRIAA